MSIIKPFKMETFKIIAIIGNRFQIPGSNFDVKLWRRSFTCLSSIREDDCLILTFNSVEKDRLDDFFNRVNQNGRSDDYHLHFASNDKWYTSIIIEEEDELSYNFKIYKEDEMISGNIVDI